MNIKSFNYIIESYINGQKKQARSLLKSYFNRDKNLSLDIVESANLYGISECILILKRLDVSDTNIINAFHDYERENLHEVKTILINNY